MVHNRRGAFGVPATWSGLNTGAVQLLFTVTLLLGSVSLVATVGGEPKTIAMVALAGSVVVLLGLALVQFSEYLRTTGRFSPEN